MSEPPELNDRSILEAPRQKRPQKQKLFPQRSLVRSEQREAMAQRRRSNPGAAEDTPHQIYSEVADVGKHVTGESLLRKFPVEIEAGGARSDGDALLQARRRGPCGSSASGRTARSSRSSSPTPSSAERRCGVRGLQCFVVASLAVFVLRQMGRMDERFVECCVCF